MKRRLDPPWVQYAFATTRRLRHQLRPEAEIVLWFGRRPASRSTSWGREVEAWVCLVGSKRADRGISP